MGGGMRWCGQAAVVGVLRVRVGGVRQSGAGLARGSPIGGMVRSVVLVHPYLFALLLAVVELTVGLLALIGLASRVAAAGGLALSLLFFLTASWHVRPFFYGADLPFAVCWLALLLANPSDLPGLDRRLLQRARAEAEAKSDTAPDASRRAFLAGLAQAGRIALAGVSDDLGVCVMFMLVRWGVMVC